MANVAYNEAKFQALKAWLESATIEAVLVMASTTVDTENDNIEFTDDFTTLDEHNGSNAERKDLAGVTITKDDTGDRAVLSANNLTWTALGAGSRDGAGILLHVKGSDDTDSVPICFLDRSFKADGGDQTFRFDGQATSGAVIRLT